MGTEATIQLAENNLLQICKALVHGELKPI
jgi:hypothetical protein